MISNNFSEQDILEVKSKSTLKNPLEANNSELEISKQALFQR